MTRSLIVKLQSVALFWSVLTSVLYAFTAKDTAQLPIRVNVDAEVIATPIEMIEGTIPDTSYSIELTANTSKTVSLPVDTKEGIPILVQGQTVTTKGFINKRGGSFELVLSDDFLQGRLELLALDGRLIAYQKLATYGQISLSLWDIASGMYILKAQKGEAVFTTKVSLSQNSFHLKTRLRPVEGTINSSRSGTSFRPTKAEYQLQFKPKSSTYADTTITVFLDRESNDALEVELKKKETQGSITDLLDAATYDKLFKHRYGVNGTPGDYDFYSFQSLVDALEFLADFEATVYSKVGAGGDRMIVKRKSTGDVHEYITTAGYHNVGGTESEQKVDYANYFNEGDLETRKQELCAYLANAAQETYGGWDNAPDGKYAWGLYWIHEAYPIYNDTTKSDRFTEDHSVYGTKATLEWSYHGRGPKQLTYNYNYGMMSDFIYFDKSKLLDDPNIIAREPKMSWVSSLWFWMTPQGQKPSCHEVMVGTWEPSAADISAGRTTSKFGMTINIINGGIECGSSNKDNIRALGRIGHYEHFCAYFNITPEDTCTCHQMSPY